MISRLSDDPDSDSHDRRAGDLALAKLHLDRNYFFANVLKTCSCSNEPRQVVTPILSLFAKSVIITL